MLTTVATSATLTLSRTIDNSGDTDRFYGSRQALGFGLWALGGRLSALGSRLKAQAQGARLKAQGSGFRLRAPGSHELPSQAHVACPMSQVLKSSSPKSQVLRSSNPKSPCVV